MCDQSNPFSHVYFLAWLNGRVNVKGFSLLLYFRYHLEPYRNRWSIMLCCFGKMNFQQNLWNWKFWVNTISELDRITFGCYGIGQAESDSMETWLTHSPDFIPPKLFGIEHKIWKDYVWTLFKAPSKRIISSTSYNSLTENAQKFSAIVIEKLLNTHYLANHQGPPSVTITTIGTFQQIFKK